MGSIRVVTIVSAMLSALLVYAGAPASAATTDECQSMLATLRADTLDAAGSFASVKDLERTVAKFDAAAAKLSEGKQLDAILKLEDVQTSLNALASASKPKLDPTVAASLIDCINTIGA